MKLTKIIAISIIIAMTFITIGCKSYAQVSPGAASVEMWDAFAAGEPVEQKGLFGSTTLEYTSKTLEADSMQVFPAVEMGLKSLSEKGKPNITRASLGAGGNVAMSSGLIKMKVDDSKKGEFFAVYKTLKLGSTQSTANVIRVIVIPMEDGTTKIGVSLGKAVKEYTAEDVFAAIEKAL